MIHQVEFLIEGHLLPITMGELHVTENLFVEKVISKNVEYDKKEYAIAYVAVEAPKDSYYFHVAINYLDFFILIHSLMSGQKITSRIGIGTTIDNLSSLGKNRITFHNYEKLHVLDEPSTFFSETILQIKKRFNELLPLKDEIMKGYLKLVFQYYYWAVQASQKRLEEAIIDLMISAEALLILNNEPIRGSISRRLSTLIARDETEKRVISQRMKKLYDLRSAIVHGRDKKPSFDEIKTLFNYVQRGIDVVLSSKLFLKETLVEKLDKNDL